VDAFFALAAPCSLSLSVRLHGAVLGCCLGIPPLLFAYREKCLDFLESMNLSCWALRPDTDGAAARELLSRLEAERFELRATIHRRALGWRHRLEAYGREILRATIPATRPGPKEDS
jgi:polysaccharide pyruvyl transferase WcaK-like protein